MPKYAVIAHDPQVDIYRESSFYGAEIVECDDERDALAETEFLKDLMGLQFATVRVKDDTPLGWRDDQEYEFYSYEE